MIPFALLLSLNVSAYTNPDAIYGDDNRVDVYTVNNSILHSLASATAALIDRSNITVSGNEALISAISLGDMYKLCPGERFRSQPTAAACSGTLIAPDIIMTAAHCYELLKDTCKNYVWVFDYKVSKENQSSVTVYTSSIYGCQKVLLKELDNSQNIDHALIKLDRPVSDRKYAVIRSQGEIRVNEPLILIGHPSGLPTKIAGDAYVLSTSANAFISNVDAFSINSGSGVFNAVTGQVEGLLASGRADYDGHGSCSTLRRFSMNEGNEKVVKPIRVKKFLESLPRH